MKVKIIKNVTLEDGMLWDDHGLVKISKETRRAAMEDYYKLLEHLKQQPTWWDFTWEEVIDEELGVGTLIIEGKGL